MLEIVYWSAGIALWTFRIGAVCWNSIVKLHTGAANEAAYYQCILQVCAGTVHLGCGLKLLVGAAYWNCVLELCAILNSAVLTMY